MTHQHHTLRPAMTAIAAAIALTSTPAFAQSVGTPDPIVDTTPAPDPLAPETTATPAPEPVVIETTAPAASTSAPSTSAAQATNPVARNRATTARTAARASSAPIRRAAAPAPIAAPAPTSSVAQQPIAPPVAPEAIAPAPIAPIAESASASAPVPVTDGVTMDEALPIAGAAGLGLLALLGAGVVLRRRRRNADDLFDNEAQYVESEPAMMVEPEPAPTFVRTPQPDPVSVAAPVAAAVVAPAAAAATLPSGFDISRFGPHVQAAYRGPTPDNPSVSLKRRLTVGHFLDKKAAEAVPTAPVEPTLKPPANPAWAARADSDFMFRREGGTAKVTRAFNN